VGALDTVVPVGSAAKGERTRAQILDAAVIVFSQLGYEGASTRAIAGEADLTQGLLTYHFPSKTELWYAAADQVFAMIRRDVVEPLEALSDDIDPRERGREAVRIYVRFAARHTAVLTFMIDAQSDAGERRAWLVDHHLRDIYERFESAMLGLNPDVARPLAPHLFYTMVGAGSLIFALGGEVADLSGLDVTSEATIDAHAELLARLMVP
jgi:AcrR family transcriptional regulator